jgi:predicted ATPase/DNA-binding SARP family transcriptional activator
MASVVRIRLFGSFAVAGDSEVSAGAWRLRKAKSLVKVLALSPGRRLHREQVMELLWPDRDPEAAANNLHQALYVARRALAAAGADAATILPLRDDMLVLAPEGDVEVDVDLFESAAARARAAGRLDDHVDALERYGGELLPEDRFEPWAASRREAVGEIHRRLLVDVAALHCRAGDVAAAAEALQQALLVDPLHEPAHRALMRLYASTGRRQQALAQYQQLREALDRALAAAPDPQTAALYRALLRGEQVEPTSDPTGAAGDGRATRPRHNLPSALTSFVGRGRELREVARLLDDHRLLTLTGAGGAGKTRLALQAAAERVRGHPDGVWLVELAALSDPALVPNATLAAVGLTVPVERPAVEGLVAQLAGWDALIVVDNCEHLLATAASMVERLLGGCPRLRILATSREPLRAAGEVTWRVPSLQLPTEDHLESEAVQLFCERARAVQTGFALSDENAEAVATIGRRLDGMPLALELAAARVNALSPAQIAERIDDSLAVLTAGRQSALDRQQTLRATIAWSHDLLTPDEQVLFRRLGVFAGTFSLEAAEHVPADEALPSRDVADLLGRLVDKSLVVAEDYEGGFRYRLLETVRQYARARLRQAGEEPALAACHLAYYFRAADGTDRDAPASLERDHDNLRAALQWALRHDPDGALALATSVSPLWMAGGYFTEGGRWLDAALAAAPAPTRARADALRAKCGLDTRLGRTARIGMLGAERVAIFRRLGDRRAVAHALGDQGLYEYQAGDYDKAEQLYAEARALAAELDDDEVTAAVLHSVGALMLSRGEFDLAESALDDSLARLEALSPRTADAFFPVHTNGLFVSPEGPGGAPRMLLEETVQVFRQVDAASGIGYVMSARADIARARGRRRESHGLLEASLAQFRSVDDAVGAAFVLNRMGNLASAVGEHDDARERLEEALEIRRRLGDRRGVRITLGNLGMLAARSGDEQAALRLIGDALAQFERDDDAPGQMGMLLNLGHLAADAGDARRAVPLLEDSRTRAERQRLFRCAGWIDLRLAELASADGAQAVALIARARDRLTALKDRWGLHRARELEEAVAKRPLSGSRQR